jgi:hypothetical protein
LELPLDRTGERAVEGRRHRNAKGLVCKIAIVVHEPLKRAHDLVAPHVHDPMIMVLRGNAIQANLMRPDDTRGR